MKAITPPKLMSQFRSSSEVEGAPHIVRRKRLDPLSRLVLRVLELLLALADLLLSLALLLPRLNRPSSVTPLRLPLPSLVALTFHATPFGLCASEPVCAPVRGKGSTGGSDGSR